MKHIIIIMLIFSLSKISWAINNDIAPLNANTFVPLRPLKDDIQIKGVIVEFLDKGDSSIGTILSYTTWRDVFTSIRDQKGAGVYPLLSNYPKTKFSNAAIVAMNKIQSHYHEAAVEAAIKQNTNMALWGVVESIGKNTTIWTYLTTIPNLPSGEFKIAMTIGKIKKITLDAGILRKKFNFVPFVVSNNKLLKRRYTVRYANTFLQTDPADNSNRIKKLSVGEPIDVDGMDKEWLRIPENNNKVTFSKIWNFDVLPRTIRVLDKPVTARNKPTKKSSNTTQLKSNNIYQVLNMRLIGNNDKHKIAWYSLKINKRSYWVPADNVQPIYTVPAVHFMAGLYRFQGKHFSKAYNEMNTFLKATKKIEDNVNIATSYQVMGMSLLMKSGGNNASLLNQAFAHFTEAINQTPYDPLPYKLRVMAALNSPTKWKYISKDILKALALDPIDEHTKDFITKIALFFSESTNKPQDVRYNVYIPDWESTKREINSLTKID